MQFVPLEAGIEISGAEIARWLAAFGQTQRVAHTYLVNAGIGERAGDEYTLDPAGWYPQKGWLRALEKVCLLLEEGGTFELGQKMADGPGPQEQSLVAAVEALDLRRHQHHRKGEKPLVGEKGELLDGVGKHAVRDSSEFVATFQSNTPEPCFYELGLLSALAKRFDAGATLVHDPSRGCRRTGDGSCTYRVEW